MRSRSEASEPRERIVTPQPSTLNPFLIPPYLCNSVRFFKPISSLFLALLLALPPVLKSVHEWSHIEENHCHDASSLHLHSIQHHCDICDVFTSQVFLTPSEEAQKNIPQEFHFKLLDHSGFTLRSSLSTSFVRGPPGIC